MVTYIIIDIEIYHNLNLIFINNLTTTKGTLTMYAIAISSKAFFDSEFANSSLAKQFSQKKKFMILHSPSEGFLKTLASRLYHNHGLESRVYEV